MNILVLCDSLNAEESSGAKANRGMVNSLVSIGYNIKVLMLRGTAVDGANCQIVSRPRFRFWELLSVFFSLFKKVTQLNLVPSFEKLSGFSPRFYADSNNFKRTAAKSENNFDLIITLSQAASFRPHHALLSFPKWHDKWLAYVHDPYPFHAYPRPYDYVTRGHQFQRSFFLKVSSQAKWLGYPSQLLAEWMESYYPPARDKALVLPHQPEPMNNKKNELPSFFDPSHFNLLHAGALMDARNPVGLLKGFKNFLSAFPEAAKNSKLIFVGPPSSYSSIFKKEKENGLPVFCSEGSLPFHQVIKMQEKASANIILEAKSSISPFLPGKFPHCVMADRPIFLLGPYYSESRRLLKNDYPFWAEIDEIDKIETIIASLYKQWKIQGSVRLNRPDLAHYCSPIQIQSTLSGIKDS
jgi:hypothetical protein